MLFRSARLQHRDARLTVLTNAATDLSRVLIDFRRIDVPAAADRLMLDRTIAQARMADHVGSDETLIFLDSDMVINRPLHTILALEDDVAVTVRDNPAMPVNGGLLVMSGRRVGVAARFFTALLDGYKKDHSAEAGWWGDQKALSGLLAMPKPIGHPKVLATPFGQVRLLPCDSWNFAPARDRSIDLPLEDKYIIHFKGARKHMMAPYWRDHLDPATRKPPPVTWEHVIARRASDTAAGSRKSRAAVAILSPYPIPPSLRQRKVVNLGDGLILKAVKRLIPAADRTIVSTRVAPTSEEAALLAEARSVIVAGANQLNDRYTVWPGLTAAVLRRSALRILPLGVGIHGEAGHAEAMSDETREIMAIIHDRIELSSWRCPLTVSYLKGQMPELSDRFVMTCCPVIFGEPLMTGETIHMSDRTIAVTVTDRGADWYERERHTLEFVARRYPRSRRLLVLHQDFEPAPRDELRRDIAHCCDRGSIRLLAERLGFEVHAPRSTAVLIALYEDVDLHFGSRVHGHLYFLSRNKRSFLTAVDDRAVGLAASLDFPLCNPTTMDDHLNFDFERVRASARLHRAQMARVVAQI